MKYLLQMSMAFILVLFVSGCDDLKDPNASIVGDAQKVIGLDSEQVKKALIEKGIVDENSTVYGYDSYKIIYTTTDESGNPVKASGLMTVPTGLPDMITEQIGLSMVSDDHGTIFADIEAPTVKAEITNSEVDTPILFTALAGFVTLQPDYIGFGESRDRYHPYLLKRSLANATVDFIKAAKKFAEDNGIKLNGQLFLTGYSEGGYSAMATLQKIEDEYLAEMPVTMAAPMAGPYSMSGMAIGTLSSPTLSVPSFMANVGYSYAKAYDKELTELFNEPYASKLDDLLGGDYNRTEIDAQLTDKTTGEDGLFDPVFVGSFTQSWFMQALLENDIYNWKAITPVRLIHCLGDTIVPIKMAQIAEGDMTVAGSSSVEVVPVEVALTKDYTTSLRYDHGECGEYAYGVAATMFAEVRKSTFGY